MDVGTGKQNGNGHADPAPLLLPSAGGTDPCPEESQPPKGAALPGAPADVSPAEGEKPASAPKVERDEKGRVKKGSILNRQGKNGGVPNINNELVRAAKAFKIGDKSFMYLLLAKALQDYKYAILVVPRLAIDVTAGEKTAAISIVNQAQATGQVNTYETMVASLEAERRAAAGSSPSDPRGLFSEDREGGA